MAESDGDRDAKVFSTVNAMMQSLDFIVYVSNELHKAYCVIEGTPYVPFDETDKEQLACNWGSIPAADAVANTIGFRRMMRDAKVVDGRFNVSGAMYLEALRRLASPEHLSVDEIFDAVNSAHLAYRAGLPFRDIGAGRRGHGMLTGARNKNFSCMTDSDKEKSWTQISLAARLMLDYIERNPGGQPGGGKEGKEGKEGTEEEGGAVFLGGSCNPTTWRRDEVMPLLEEAGVKYVDERRGEKRRGEERRRGGTTREEAKHRETRGEGLTPYEPASEIMGPCVCLRVRVAGERGWATLCLFTVLTLCRS